jgi:hypothetical protein
VIVELSVFDIEKVFSHPVHQYITGLGYTLHSKLCNSCIYVSRQGENSIRNVQ